MSRATRTFGYRVTIRGFLPADRKSVENVAHAVNLIMAAQGDPTKRGELADALVGVTLDVKPTSVPGVEPEAGA